jgi:plastocyanin
LTRTLYFFASLARISKTKLALSSIMKFQVASALFALAGTVAAQTMHVVTVGNGGLKFCPEQITAASGDLVQFQFYPNNHTVTQGFFAKGCTPISQAPAPNTAQGAFSGFMPVSNTSEATTIPTFTVTVNGTSPMWFYCSQAKHCQSGMVFAINPTAAKSLQGYKGNCANATANLVPSLDGSGSGSSSPGSPPSAAGTAVPPSAAPPPATVATLPTANIVGNNPPTTSLPINSLASETVSRTVGWLIVSLAGCLTVAMLL